MYSEKVKDHFKNPRNVGEIDNASGVGTVGNAKCGDIMRMYLDIDDATRVIKISKWRQSRMRIPYLANSLKNLNLYSSPREHLTWFLDTAVTYSLRME